MSINPTPEVAQVKAETFFRRHPSWFLAYYESCFPAMDDQRMTTEQATQLLETAQWQGTIQTNHSAARLSSYSGRTDLPWTEELIARFEDDWNWGDRAEWDNPPDDWLEYLPRSSYSGGLSSNEGLPWSERLIDRFQHRWHWDWLSLNNALPRSIDLINRFSERWNWALLSYNHPWTIEVIERFSDRWSWVNLSHSQGLPWSEQFIDQFSDAWDWDALSRNPSLPWSEKFIDRYASRWDWEALSRNSGLPWSIELLNKYASRWDWDGLSRRDWLPWSEEFIRLYADRWSWHALAENLSITWPSSLVNTLIDKLGRDVTDLQTMKIPWLPEHINSFKKKHWNWDWLSSNTALPWSKELLAQYAKRWNWHRLSRNPCLPWSADLIEHFTDRWDWNALSANKGIPWSVELVECFVDRWNWHSLIDKQIVWPESLAERLQGLKAPCAVQNIYSPAPVFRSVGSAELSKFNLTKQQISALSVDCIALSEKEHDEWREDILW
jgi:hypothetical protein